MCGTKCFDAVVLGASPSPCNLTSHAKKVGAIRGMRMEKGINREEKKKEADRIIMAQILALSVCSTL